MCRHDRDQSTDNTPRTTGTTVSLSRDIDTIVVSVNNALARS